MPNPKLETYKNKATGTVYDYTDAAAQASIAAIEEKIPDVASSENQLVTEAGLNNVLNFKEDKVPGKGLSTNDYDNTAKGIVDNIQSNVIANTKLIKDTVGWSGKNLLPNNVVDGNYASVILTRNANGSFTLNGGPASGNTASMVMATLTLPAGKYILSKSGRNDGYFQVTNEAQSQELYYAGTSDALIELSVATTMVFRFRILQGATFSNEVFYPMLRDANILDSTYEPYFGSTAFPRSEQAVLGAKNLLPLTFSGDTQNNVVFTVDDDGVININGTNSGEAFAVIISPYSKWLKDGRYILNGCSGGSASTYKLDIDSPSGAFATNYDGDTEFTMVNGANNYRIRIVVYAGAVMNNVKIRPMIRLASDTDSSYVPYAMTNRELTENNAVKNLVITPSSGITINTGSYAKIRNGILNAYISLKSESEDITAFTELARIDGISGANDELFNFAGVNTTANSVVVCYCPFIKATGRIAIQTRTNVTANQTVNVAITAILE